MEVDSIWVFGRRVKKGSQMAVLLRESLHVRVGLWVCGRGDGDTGLGAYVGEDWLDDVEVSHLCALWG